MFKFVILLSAVACALGAAIPEGMVPELDGRIVGGTATSITSYPYQISLQRSGSHSCGGSVYNNKIIVTAAHCVKGVSASTLQVRAGSSYWNSGGVVVKVSNIKINENYNSVTKNYDVAVLKLSSSLTYSSSIKNIALATKDPASGASAVVTGWGTLKSGGSIPSQLQVVTVKIVLRAACGSNYGYSSSQITNTMICAAAAGKDSCQGDSGGPLVSGNVLVGVVSWGNGCAQSNYPGVYADVAVLNSWITNAAKTV